MKPTLLIPLTVIAPMLVAAPPEIDPIQLAEFERKVARRVIPNLDGEKNFEKADLLNKDVDLRLALFLDTVDQTTLISQTDAPAEADDVEKDPLEGLFEPGPDSLVITCSKGVYLDGETYEIVYLGEIKIQGQGVTMTCKEDLKALFHPPEDKPAEDKPAEDKPAEDKATEDKQEDVEKEAEKEDPLAKFGGFGDLKQFTAAGEVRVNGVNEKGQKFHLGGDRALYEMVKVGEKIHSTITFRGDKLAFLLGDPKDKANKDGSVALRSISKNATAVVTLKDKTVKVRLSDNGWETHLGLPTEE